MHKIVFKSSSQEYVRMIGWCIDNCLHDCQISSGQVFPEVISVADLQLGDMTTSQWVDARIESSLMKSISRLFNQSLWFESEDDLVLFRLAFQVG